MRNELDSKLVLAVFEKMRTHGTPSKEGYLLDGLVASSDFDGYTLFIKDALVSLSFGFHNQYHFNYEKEEHLANFESKLKQIFERY